MGTKVRLTSYGVPFGRVMFEEVARIYIEETIHSLKGLHYVATWQVVGA